jgi:predicted enzyme related to lactoylglutathione lyase
MSIRLLNAYILAENFDKLVSWYIDTFSLEKGLTSEEDYHSTELTKNGKFVIAFAEANEMGVKPAIPRNNTVVVQFVVSDVAECLEGVKNGGGKVLFGPSFDKTGGFYYGGFSDIEGNQIWIVQG